MTDEELARNIINPCGNFACAECPLRNQAGECVLNYRSGDDNRMAIEWLGKEYDDIV